MTNLTMTDLFCGAGGSSTGAVAVPGVTVRLAANHWDLAIETHNTNHPTVDHLQADISNTNPRYVPTTDLLWASPECTNHSRAKGRKQALQPDLFGETISEDAVRRSRATMWDVIRFTEAHRYRAVIVENVVEVADWGDDGTARGGLFEAWLLAMRNMGYEHRIISLNSMHAQRMGVPAPQSRDRVYIVFWRRGERAPDFEQMLRPQAWCSSCECVVEARQWWKKGDGKRPGRYRSQYLYRCPNTACRNQIVEPAWLPASSIIDWSNPGVRIGDRDKPLSPKTMRRIEVGIERYWSPLTVEMVNGYDAADPKHPGFGDPGSYYRAWPTSDVVRTIPATDGTKAIATHPLLIPVEGRAAEDRARSMLYPSRAMTTRSETGIAYPPFIAELRGGGSTARPTADALATVTASGNHHALVVPAGGTWNEDARPTSAALRTLHTREAYGLVVPYYGNGQAVPDGRALPTVTTVERHALIHRNNGGGAEMTTPASEPVRTITTAGHQSVLQSERPTIDVNDVRFRMLEPGEIKQAMAFPGDYVMVGTRREQVKLAGNAVTPPAARDLVATVVAAITGEGMAA